MLVRLFPEGFAFVQGQELAVENVHNGLFVIPLTEEEIDMNTLQTDVDIQIVDTNVATVYKGANAYQGVLLSHDGQIATLSSRGTRTIIRDYDRIQMSDFIVARSVNGVLPETLTLSYVTNAIHGTVIHNLDINTGVLTSYLRIQNETANDLNDATVEIVTSRQANAPIALFRAESMAASLNDATVSSGAGGAIYTLNGTFDIPSGYEVTLPIASYSLNGDVEYVIDAPNGTSNAQYTLRWVSPATLIPGQLLVFRDNVLEARSSLDLVAEGQEMTTDLLRTSAVYARGTISTQRQRMRNDQTTTSTNTVNIVGTIFNTLNMEIDVQLRYFVGDQAVSSNDGVVENGYLVWDYVVAPRSQQQYNHSFILSE